MEKTIFTTKDIVERLDIPMQRLRMWLMEEYIAPSVPSDGQGKKAYFSINDMYAIVLFSRLLAKGFKRELASRYIREFQKGAAIFTNAPYLFFLAKDTESGKVVEPRSFTGINPLKLSIWPDKVSLTDFEAESDQCDWDDIIIFNFAKLKKEVNEMLK